MLNRVKLYMLIATYKAFLVNNVSNHIKFNISKEECQYDVKLRKFYMI